MPVERLFDAGLWGEKFQRGNSRVRKVLRTKFLQMEFLGWRPIICEWVINVLLPSVRLGEDQATNRLAAKAELKWWPYALLLAAGLSARSLQ